MDSHISIHLADPHLRIPAGDDQRILVSLHNGTEHDVRLRLEVEGPPPEWIDLGKGATDIHLRAGTDATVTIGVRVPPDQPLAMLPMIIRATDTADSHLSASAFGALTVVDPVAAHEPEPDIPPLAPAPPPPPLDQPAPTLADPPSTLAGSSPGEARELAPRNVDDEAIVPAVPGEPHTSALPLPLPEELPGPLPPGLPARDEHRPDPPEAAAGIELSLVPDEHFPERFSVVVRNTRAEASELLLTVTGDRALRFDRPPGPFLVPAGGTLQIPLHVLRSRRGQRSAAPQGFTVEIADAAGTRLAAASGEVGFPAPAALEGSPGVESRVSSRQIMAVLAALVVLVVIAFLGFRWQQERSQTPESNELAAVGMRPVVAYQDQLVALAPQDGQTRILTRPDPASAWQQAAEAPAAVLPGVFAKFLSLSPGDGAQRRLLYVTADNEAMQNAELWTVPIDGSTPAEAIETTPPIADGWWIAQPVWSPDGQQIAYVRRAEGGLELRVMHSDGTANRRVEAGPAFQPEVFYGANSNPLTWVDDATLAYVVPGPDGAPERRQLVRLATRTVETSTENLPLPSPGSVSCWPIFSQNDPRWVDDETNLAGGSIGASGCALTASAMALALEPGPGGGAPLTDPAALNACILGQKGSSAPLDWANAAACAPDGGGFAPAEPFSYRRLSETLANTDGVVIVALRGGQTGTHDVIVNRRPSSGVGAADAYGVTDPWDGTTYKTLATFIALGYVPAEIVVYEPPPSVPSCPAAPRVEVLEIVSGELDAVVSTPEPVVLRLPADASGQPPVVPEATVRPDPENGGYLVTLNPEKEGVHVYSLPLAAGETSQERVVTLTIDQSPPQTISEIKGEQTADGQYAGAATVTMRSSDALSAVNGISYRLDEQEPVSLPGGQPPAIVIAEPGEHSLEYWAEDVAANTEAPRRITIEIVAAPASPTASLATAGTPPPTLSGGTVATPPAIASGTPGPLAIASPATAAAAVVPYTPATTARPATIVPSPTPTSTPPSTPVPTLMPTAPLLPPSSPAQMATLVASTSTPVPTATRAPATSTPLPPTPLPPTSTPEPTEPPTLTATATATSTPLPTATLVVLTSTPQPTATARPTDTPVPPRSTPLPTVTPTPLPTATWTPTPLPTVTPTPTPMPTATPLPTATPVPPTSTPSPTSTPAPPTSTPEPTATPVPPTSTPAPTNTPLPPTPTPSPAPTHAPTPTPTSTPLPPTSTPLPPTNTPVPTSTPLPMSTPTPTSTPIPTSTPEPTPTATPVACAPSEPTASRVELPAPTREVLPSQQAGDQTVPPRVVGEVTNASDSYLSEVTVTVCVGGASYDQVLRGGVQPNQTVPYRIEIPDLPADATPMVVAFGVRDAASLPTDLPVSGARFNPPSVERDGLASVSSEVSNPLPLDVLRADIWVTIYKPDRSVREVVQELDVSLSLGVGESTTLDIRLPNVRTLPEGSAVSVRVVATETRKPTPTPTPVPTQVPPTPTPEPIVSVPVGFVGQWVGVGTEQIDGEEQMAWPISITIDGGDLGERVGAASYPTLECESTLTLNAVTSRSIEVYEQLMSPGQCEEIPGRIVLTLDDDSLTFERNGALFATGSLWPAAALPAEYIDVLSGLRPEVGPNRADAEFTMTLEGGVAGEFVGYATYPTLGCTTTLTLVRVGPAFVYLFEKPVEGESRCPEGLVMLELEEDGTIFME